MQKLIKWWNDHFLQVGTLFLLFFIPLFPKIPLLPEVLDIKNTWVYIRLEDVLVALLSAVFLIRTFRNKTVLSSPLSIPIVLYWIAGAITTVYALIVFVPQLDNFFPTLTILFYLRRIEYMILFFIALNGVRTMRFAKQAAIVFCLTVFLVDVYGILQKLQVVPAYLTMNEEFAKGIPILLGETNRIASTFAGHYDLAAYLIFALPFIAALFFATRNAGIKVGIAVLFFFSYYILLLTASRVSFGVYVLSMILTFILLNKKLILIPVLIASFLLVGQVNEISSRFEKTIRVSEIVYDPVSGQPIATLEDFQKIPTPTPLVGAPVVIPSGQEPTPTPYEELPTGSGFVEIPFRTKRLLTASESGHLATSSGEFLVREGLVFDISFTTRLQGGWPRALNAFKRNFLLGSGYSSIDLASDNNYLRILGESGVLGLGTFLSIFFVFLLVVRQGMRTITDRFAYSFLIGVAGGVFGLILNAVLIDVFEASKVAYVLWTMMGITIGVFMLEAKRTQSLFQEAYAVLKYPFTSFCLLGLAAIVYFSDSISIYFTADDWIWLRLIATETGSFISYLTQSNGFYYRPLITMLLKLVYPFFGLDPVTYHFLSILAHLGSSFAVFLIVQKISKSISASFGASILFLIHPIHAENVLWFSGYSSLLSGMLYLFSFYLFLLSYHAAGRIYKYIYYSASLVLFIGSLLSYELSVTVPLVIFFYSYLITPKGIGSRLRSLNSVVRGLGYSGLYILIADIYWYLRSVSGVQGIFVDNHDMVANFPVNVVGNLLGYAGQMIAGYSILPWYDVLGMYFNAQNIVIPLITSIILVLILYVGIKKLRKTKYSLFDNFSLFFLIWFVITLIPVLGMETIAEQYLYTASFGFIAFVAYETRKLARLNKMLFALSLVVLMFLLIFYSVQFFHIKNTWLQAGNISRSILRSLPTTYKTFPENAELYFINVPTYVEHARVYPVGLEDAIWFIYRKSNIKIIRGTDIQEALEYKEVTPNVFIFLYEAGALEEIEPIRQL